MRHLNIAALAVATVLSVSALGGSASAMPLGGLARSRRSGPIPSRM
jgi:hypothetical protein